MTVKLLWIGCYRDGTGYAQASIDYILALDSVGVDIVCRPLKLNAHKPKLPDRILELEGKSSKGCNYVVQHCLPHQYDYNGRFKKNIALYASETTHFSDSVWESRLNNMDVAWVINRQMVDAARDSGVKIPIEIVPHASDIQKYQRTYPLFDGLKPYKNNGDFIFYFVGEMVRRKNLAALLRAFHTEFHPSEKVQLVIKTSKPGMSQDELEKHVQAFCKSIRDGLKVHSTYKPEIVILDRLSDDEMMSLHSACDCFVCPSYGEAWCIPAFTAMAMGKTPIVTDFGGFVDYLSDNEGWLIPNRLEPVFGVNDSFEDLYTGNEQWANVDVQALRWCMRQAYSQEKERKEKALNGIKRAYDFSYESVGNLMRKLLYSYEQNESRNRLEETSR